MSDTPKDIIKMVDKWPDSRRQKQAESSPKTSPLYQKLETIFKNRQGGNHKTMFVFINGYAELEFRFVERNKHDWTEHDRLVSERGGGYAIMAFDLDKPFEHQFPLHKYGHFNEGNAEGLNYFSINPLINIPDRTGTVIPAETGRKALHQIMAGAAIATGWNNPNADQLLPKPTVPVTHLRLV